MLETAKSFGKKAALSVAITALLMASAYGSAAAAPLADPPPMRTRIVLRGVHFEFNQWNIRPGDDAVLDEAIAVLRTHPRLIIWIDGYTDSIGDAKINKAISDMRAISVAEYLENHGVYPSQCMPIGYGKTDFVASNKTDEGRAQNRRVELVQSNIR